ncbi:39S ribosomal protein L12, mitochondrial-like [Limulus polyphemus]|uniref:39S ribosomal protein L12, mitochondrial-like n=1 Tax=Limulus polyphemus TaxID=6850 RepID=A0ABM1BUG0_LIMPO|nr:39S ribosomal protein L12, mitochondrial-like [Limulus polyphemus]
MNSGISKLFGFPRSSFYLTIINRPLRQNKQYVSRLPQVSFSVHSCRYCSTEVLKHPEASGAEKMYPVKIQKIVEDIAQLTLIEVADLNELLKKTLNIQDTPVMAMGAMPMGGVATAPAEEEEEEAPKTAQTSFKVKLVKFNDSKKVALIKEIKNILEGMNLVQAKKFVESAPIVVKADIPKDEAEKLKEALEAVGATCEVE